MIVLQGAPRGRVDVLQFSPDGRLMAAPRGGRVLLWADPTIPGPPTTTLDIHSVWMARFTPDGRKLVLAVSGSDVCVHDLATGELILFPRVLPDRGGFDLSPDGRFLLVLQHDIGLRPPGRLLCWPVDDPASLAWSADTTREAYAPPLFLPGGDRFVLFEGSPDYVPFWYVTLDARTGRVLAKVMGLGRQSLNPALSADRTLVAARDGVWAAVFRTDDFGAGPVAELRNDNRKELTGLAFHPSGRYLAATSNDATVKLYDTSTWRMVRAFDWDVGRLRSIAFSPDGALAAAGDDKGKIVVWDVD
jgi:WD40 repeat protein